MQDFFFLVSTTTHLTPVKAFLTFPDVALDMFLKLGRQQLQLVLKGELGSQSQPPNTFKQTPPLSIRPFHTHLLTQQAYTHTVNIFSEGIKLFSSQEGNKWEMAYFFVKGSDNKSSFRPYSKPNGSTVTKSYRTKHFHGSLKTRDWPQQCVWNSVKTERQQQNSE